MAPETILYPECSGYRANVDIWAASVTVCDCTWNLLKSDYPATEKGHAALAQWYKNWINLMFRS